MEDRKIRRELIAYLKDATKWGHSISEKICFNSKWTDI
jgi:hypothetical protein